MELYKKWSIHMKNNIGGGGVMPPVLDPFDPTVFYVSDGWGSYYSSMRLRKLSAETGEELASVLTRDCTRCVHIEEDRMFAVLNKRLLELDRSDLHVRRAYKKGVPQYMDYAGFNGEDKLLLMNWNGGFLNVFDLNTEKTRKKKVDTCCGIWRENENSFLILNGSAILRYDLAGNMEKLAGTQPCSQSILGPSGRLYLLCKGPAEGELDSSRLVIYPSAAEGTPRELILEEPVQHFVLSRDETRLLLMRDNCIRLYSIPEERTIFRHEFEGEFAFEDGLYMLHETIFTYRWSEKKLTCWRIVE
ncbi:MAG: hypothetical protein HFF52_00605 [Lawsonibacter sp.]|nr:hypothetical protein [Lawsonibacter sp.]